MTRTLLVIFLCTLISQFAFAQKKTIERKIAQKNYDAYILMQEGKYSEALPILDEAIASDPEAFFIYQNRALCRLNVQDTSGAISDYLMNIRLEPANTESKYALGNIYKNLKDSMNTTKYFVLAMNQADDEFSQTKMLYMSNFLGNHFRNEEKYDSALVYYNLVKTFTPENSSTFINSAVCYFHLDSMDRFCSDLEQAFVLGGAVNCITLKAYCNGCNHLLDERGGNTDTLSRALDKRLRDIISNEKYFAAQRQINSGEHIDVASSKVTIYFNQYWQICKPDNAKFYREAFWAPRANFFGGDFTDYYIDGKMYATGRIESKKLNGAFTEFYHNGQQKISGQFVKGVPVGKWQYFLENGEPDFEVEFTMEDFKLHFSNPKNPNYSLNSGSGKFLIELDRWNNMTTELMGEFFAGERNGTWQYLQDGDALVTELYKNGKFKRGSLHTTMGKLKSESVTLNAVFFTPPYLLQINRMYFDYNNTITYYPFIRVNLF